MRVETLQNRLLGLALVGNSRGRVATLGQLSRRQRRAAERAQRKVDVIEQRRVVALRRGTRLDAREWAEARRNAAKVPDEG